jgi:hypothetical protein
MENEVWKDVAIEGLGEIYQVSNYGRVLSKERTFTRIHPITNKITEFRAKSGILKPSLTNKGYFRISLGKGRKKFSVHRVVLMTFGNLPINDKMQVNHIDGDKTNNHIDNLEWLTNRENIIHAYANNLIHIKKGEFNLSSKKLVQLDSTTGEVIKEWGCLSYVKEQLNYDLSNISNACNGKRKTAYGFKWKYI